MCTYVYLHVCIYVYIYVCIYVCIYVYIYVCLHVHVRLHKPISIHTNMYIYVDVVSFAKSVGIWSRNAHTTVLILITCAYIYTPIYMYIFIYLHVYTCIYIYIYIYTYVYVYIYKCTYIYTFMYIRIHMHIYKLISIHTKMNIYADLVGFAKSAGVRSRNARITVRSVEVVSLKWTTTVRGSPSKFWCMCTGATLQHTATCCNTRQNPATPHSATEYTATSCLWAA